MHVHRNRHVGGADARAGAHAHVSTGACTRSCIGSFGMVVAAAPQSAALPQSACRACARVCMERRLVGCDHPVRAEGRRLHAMTQSAASP
jgi:hypothetical protein